MGSVPPKMPPPPPRQDGSFPPHPPPPPIREVREGFGPEALVRLGCFLAGVLFASIIWGALS